MKIYLIGYMASGKSRLGKDLASRIGYDFIDLDDLFEQHYRISIYDFFEKYGEDVFRKMEKEILHGTSGLKNTVIATGGGTPCYFDNMDFIRSAGVSIYLRYKPETLAMRLIEVKRKRPLIRETTLEGMEEYVRDQMRSREPVYASADHIIDETADFLDKVLSIPEIASLIHPA